MCLVDYRGFRLIAISILPIDANNTIVYGTCDAGRTIHADHPRLNRLMKMAAGKLNIQSHVVRDCVLHSPADLEGHLVHDKV